MRFLVSLDHITPADASRVGGKAYNCAWLKQIGFPVPEGAAVVAEAMGSAAALAELDAWLSQLPADALLAVRSSAADEDSAGHSFAGIHESRLNVPRNVVAEAVRSCWISVQSARALAYRRAVGLPTGDVRAGVLIQEMVQPVVSGVAFTVDPVTGAREELVIIASWGLGEAVVSGLVEPDEFHVRKSDCALLQQQLGGKQYRVLAEQGVSRLVQTREDERAKLSLSEEQLRELAGLLIRLEQHFGTPQDVEWCHDGANFWILQSRPVTGAAPPRGPDIEWTRANFREVLPDLPSPQFVEMVRGLLNRMEPAFYGKLLGPPELGPMVKIFYGRPYFNVSRMRYVCFISGMPAALFMRTVGHAGEVTAEDEARPRPPLREFLPALPDLLWAASRQLRLGHRVRRQLGETARLVALVKARDPKELSDAELSAALDLWLQAHPRWLFVVLSLAGIGLYEDILERLCAQVGFPSETLLRPHQAAPPHSVSTQQAFDLLALARSTRSETRAREFFLRPSPAFDRWREELRGTGFLPQFEAYLDNYGHRGHYESDWSLPRFREDPAPLLFAIQQHVRAPSVSDPEAIAAGQAHAASQAWSGFIAHLTSWQRLTIAPRVRWLLRRIKQMYVWREVVRSEMMKLTAELRAWFLVMAERFHGRGWIDERDDFFFLLLDEVRSALHDPSVVAALRERAAARKQEQEAWRALEMPLLMRESELPRLLRRTAASSDAHGELRGFCISPGYAAGEVVVISSPDEFCRMRPGAILVAPATDPAWTPLFTLAAGVIVEVGGTLSHAATVAREYGLPALANVKDATHRLKDGDRVWLDATAGFVEVRTRALDTHKHA